ncbi:hypothetical protein M407DRAFT_176211 [Tulasnella calospora MUT 4182]|uniref:Uncharacterized protein n=1 Tax=Tulasnella calospora MUT 4182 TaxID=1051891 RepID=A0A0C3Q2P4_9AGAM|nr:hypothetical protein M407DRAFT_176211 [Tulasnella calospora MUT 4182]
MPSHRKTVQQSGILARGLLGNTTASERTTDGTLRGMSRLRKEKQSRTQKKNRGVNVGERRKEA